MSDQFGSPALGEGFARVSYRGLQLHAPNVCVLYMRPLGADLRERILAISPDVPSEEVAERFGVAGSSVRKLRRRFVKSGAVAADPFPGRARIVDGEAEARLRALVAAQPDATLLELCDKLQEETGLAVSEATMSRQMQRMGITRKKKR